MKREPPTVKFRTLEERCEHEIRYVENDVSDETRMGYRRYPPGEQMLSGNRFPRLHGTIIKEIPSRVDHAYNPPTRYKKVRTNVVARGFLHVERGEVFSINRLIQRDLFRWARKYKLDVATNAHD